MPGLAQHMRQCRAGAAAVVEAARAGAQPRPKRGGEAVEKPAIAGIAYVVLVRVVFRALGGGIGVMRRVQPARLTVIATPVSQAVEQAEGRGIRGATDGAGRGQEM